jgi:UDP:flavonoid glycosyltransferase YjiC (YdhE family)
MRVLCVSAQMPGHLDWGGYLATAVELQRRGHEVLWVSGAAVQPHLQRAGIPMHSLAETGWRWPPPPPLRPQPGMDAQTVQRLRMERGLDQWLDVARVAAAVEELTSAARKFAPDLIVSEAFVSAAGVVAERLDVPFVVAGWPALQPPVTAAAQPVVDVARQRLHELLQRFDIRGVNWTHEGAPALLSPHLHVTYWSERWYEGLPLLPQTRHVGGAAHQTAVAGASVEPPRVFITLGTSFANDANFFHAAAHAAVQAGTQPLVALGGFQPSSSAENLAARLPSETLIQQRVDFDAVLPQVAAAIHHGGAGTTHALVIHGVPQIIVPHAADQMHQAQGVTRTGVGVYFPARQVTIARLRQALQEMLPADSGWSARALALREEFAALGGPPRAADLMERVASIKE